MPIQPTLIAAMVVGDVEGVEACCHPSCLVVDVAELDRASCFALFLFPLLVRELVRAYVISIPAA